MENTVNPNTVLTFMVVGIAVMLLLALSLILFFIFSQRKLYQQQMKAQLAEIQFQESLVQHNLTTQEEERRRIAADLHDDIGAKLGVLNLAFHRLRRTNSEQPQYAEMCTEIDDLIANTLNTTRRISHELLPPTLEEFGLQAALEEFCRSIDKTGAVHVEFESNLPKNALTDLNQQLNLFRIVQELASNTIKYAQATLIRLDLTATETGGQLRYRDDGQGFNLAEHQGKGLGLKNMESRAKMIGANLQFQTQPDEGVTVTIDF
jgi:two-component system, NarL family, sensor kinase